MPEWLLFWMLGTVASGFAYWCGWDHRGDWDSRQRDENYDAMRAENKRLRAATDARLDGPAYCPDCPGEPFNQDDIERHRRMWHREQFDGGQDA